VPLAELRYKVQFTADQGYVDLLEEARNLLQDELPARDWVEVQRRALQLLVHKLRQRKYAASERPRRSAPASASEARPAEPNEPPIRHDSLPSESESARARPLAPAARAGHAAPQSATAHRHGTPKSLRHSRYIPAEARRSVWQRDEARCTYRDARGQRCREQSGLQFHHHHPHARGGPPNVENLTLRCRAHNILAAEHDFGRDLIRQKRRAAGAERIRIRAGADP